MNIDSTFVRMRSSDHLWDAKISKKAPRFIEFNFLRIALDRTRFSQNERKVADLQNWFLGGGKISINRHKAICTFLDNMFRSVSLQVQYKDTVRTNFQLNFIDLGIWNQRY